MQFLQNKSRTTLSQIYYKVVQGRKYSIKTATRLVVILLTVAVFVCLAPQVFAQASLGLEAIDDTGLGTTDLKGLIMKVLQILLGFLGIVAVIIILYGGYIYMTSEGEQDKIAKAKGILINAVIGLVIILSAFAIVTYIINKFNDVMFGDGGQIAAMSGFDISGGALGGGVLDSVYPDPGSVDIPRNTLIMVGFKEVMSVDTIINTNAPVPDECDGVQIDCGYLAGNVGYPNVRILNLIDETILDVDEVVVMSPDGKNFVFSPYGQHPDNHLGNANGNTGYAVNLTGNIDKGNGSPAFILDGYTWQFEVSNFLDLVPPQVDEVIPLGNDVYMNAVIQMDFNEAINAAATVGIVEIEDDGSLVEGTFSNLTISYLDEGQTKYVSGEFVISNQFRTVTFVPNTPCLDDEGFPIENTCGEEVFCLPEVAEVLSLVQAAEIEPFNPLSGVSDAAGNSLDGGGKLGVSANGTPEGPPMDNFDWDFTTNDDMWLYPPHITNPLIPEMDSDLVPRNRKIRASFNIQLMSSTLNTDNISIFKAVCNDEANFPADPTCYPSNGFTIYKENIEFEGENAHQVVIRTYSPYLDGLTTYNPRFTSGVRDVYQNCFYPACGPGSGGECVQD